MIEKNKGQVWFDIMLFIGFVFSGLFVAQFIAVLCLLPLHENNFSVLMESLNNPLSHPSLKLQLLFVQGISSFFSFVIAPLVYIKWKEKGVKDFLYRNQGLDSALLLYTVMIVVVSIPFTALLVEWNQSLALPEGFKAFEIWAKEKELFLEKVTQMLTTLHSPWELFLGLIVIAFIPALGEELVFRGYLQNKFQQATGSVHVAIWTSAFLFSAIHFQFYGFLPRMVLGALFGYIYSYTGQFHLPVLAHFTNNGLTLLLIYLKQHEMIEFDIESEQEVPLYSSFISLVFTGILFFLLHKRAGERRLSKIF